MRTVEPSLLPVDVLRRLKMDPFRSAVEERPSGSPARLRLTDRRLEDLSPPDLASDFRPAAENLRLCPGVLPPKF